MHEKYYYTYIVASRSLTLYIGMTGNLPGRVFQHKRKLHQGFSATNNCNRLVWFEQFADPRRAIAREKQLKGWTRAKKLTLIKTLNPTWIDLSEDWYSKEQLTWIQIKQKSQKCRRPSETHKNAVILSEVTKGNEAEGPALALRPKPKQPPSPSRSNPKL